MKAVGFKFPFSNGKDVMVLTAMAFELDKKTAEAVANLDGLDIMDIAIKNAGRGRGEGMPIVDRIDAFLVGSWRRSPCRYRTRNEWERCGLCSRSRPVWEGRPH